MPPASCRERKHPTRPDTSSPVFATTDAGGTGGDPGAIVSAAHDGQWFPGFQLWKNGTGASRLTAVNDERSDNGDNKDDGEKPPRQERRNRPAQNHATRAPAGNGDNNTASARENLYQAWLAKSLTATSTKSTNNLTPAGRGFHLAWRGWWISAKVPLPQLFFVLKICFIECEFSLRLFNTF